MDSSSELPAEFAAGPFRYSDARAAGLSEGRLRAKDLERPFHGIRIERGDKSIEVMCRALALRLPEEAFFNSVTAAHLWGIPLPPWLASQPEIHAAVINPRRGIQAAGVTGHKIKPMGNDWIHSGELRVATPERTWCELAVVLPVGDLVAAGDYMIFRGAPISTREAISDAVLRFPDRRFRRRIQAALPLLDERSESPGESRLRVAMIQHGLRGFELNYPIRACGYSYRADFAFPQQRVIVEYQGDYHREKSQWRRDMTRRSRLEAAGWIVIEVNADDLANPRELCDRIRRTLATHRS